MVNSIQSAIYQGYGSAAAALLAETFNVFRGAAGESNPTQGSSIFTLQAVFTNGKLSGNNFTRGYGFDDIVLAGMFDASNCEPGDYLVGQVTGNIFFIMAMEPMLPIMCIQANRTATLTRSETQLASAGGDPAPSQSGGSVPYWGREEDSGNTAPITAPCAMLASSGRATSRSDYPSSSPGPSRWRIYMPISTFPKGSVFDRDYIADEEGNRYMVEAAGWTNQGYRLEAVRQVY